MISTGGEVKISFVARTPGDQALCGEPEPEWAKFDDASCLALDASSCFINLETSETSPTSNFWSHSLGCPMFPALDDPWMLSHVSFCLQINAGLLGPAAVVGQHIAA